jgi:DNA-binding PadR family transcriptional regulator
MATRTLNATSASLLGFLLGGPQSGWDLVETARQRIGDYWSLTRSQVYRELAAMEDRGLIESGDVGPRERRPYTITAAGRTAFQSWLREPPGPEQIRYPLLLKLSFGRHLTLAEIRDFLTEHREQHAAKLASYEQRLPELREHGDEYAVAVLQFGIRYEQAVLDWFDNLDLAALHPEHADAEREQAATRPGTPTETCGSTASDKGSSPLFPV